MMASKRNFTSRTPRNPLDTHFPALCRARVEYRNVLLGPRSSLHHLRRGAKRLFVRQLHRYYSAVRPLNGVHVRRAAIAFPDRSPIRRDTAEISRFSCMLFLVFVSKRAGFSDYAGPGFRSRLSLPPVLPSRHSQGGGARI